MVGVLRHSRADALLVAGAIGHGLVLAMSPPAPVIAIAMWWNANTIAHNFIHLPFFRSRAANAAFSAYSSVLLGLPQTLWRDRHLAHHAGVAWRMRWSRPLAIELALVAVAWMAIAARGPDAFLTWLGGWLGGLALCAIHGYYEHARGVVSHYGAAYNRAFFNDGYHVEHHARPSEHWTRLPRLAGGTPPSTWPAVLRWLEAVNLDTLETFVLRSRLLQWFVLDRHARAFRKLMAELPVPRRITIVGGGLFPRTALILRRLAPDAEITIVDRSAVNLRRAQRFLDDSIRRVEATYSRDLSAGSDLVILPLAFCGDRTSFYNDPPAPAVASHDWIWNARGHGFLVSVFLLKRLNLVTRP